MFVVQYRRTFLFVCLRRCLFLSLKIFFFTCITHNSFTYIIPVIYIKVAFTGKYTVIHFINKRFLTLMCIKITCCKTSKSNVNHVTCKMFTSLCICIKVRPLLCQHFLHFSQSKSLLFLCIFSKF